MRIEAELVNSPSLTDGYIDLRFAPEIALRAGQFKQPFSLEELASDNLIDFVLPSRFGTHAGLHRKWRDDSRSVTS